MPHSPLYPSPSSPCLSSHAFITLLPKSMGYAYKYISFLVYLFSSAIHIFDIIIGMGSLLLPRMLRFHGLEVKQSRLNARGKVDTVSLLASQVYSDLWRYLNYHEVLRSK